MLNVLKLILIAGLGCLVACCQSQTSSQHKELNGSWLAELNSNDIGVARTVLTFEFGDSTFSAWSRKNADRDILGFWKSTLGRWFTSDFKHGALLNITNGKLKQHGDTILLSGIFRSAMGSYYFRGSLHRGILQAKLLTSKQTVKGTITGIRKTQALPLGNYPALIQKALQTTREQIYNPSVLATGEWNSFEKNIKHLAENMQDDIEMVFAFYYLASKLSFSHYALLRQDPQLNNNSDTLPAEKQVLLEEKLPGTLHMTIKSFSGSAAEMDTAFAIIARKHYTTVIVDLRDNPGGNVEPGMSFARHLADTTFYGGVFLTQKWFSQNTSVPAVRDYSLFPAFTEKNYDLLINGIHHEKGLCLKVTPEAPVYKGRLYILTSGVTASTCEPIVYWLKQRHRATLVGATTAGAMLNGEFFKLNDGFSLFLPTADYYAADGYRIDHRGVNPDMVVEPAKALDHVLSLIKK